VLRPRSAPGGGKPGGLARMLLWAIFSVAAVLLALVAVRQTMVGDALGSGELDDVPAAAWGGPAPVAIDSITDETAETATTATDAAADGEGPEEEEERPAAVSEGNEETTAGADEEEAVGAGVEEPVDDGGSAGSAPEGSIPIAIAKSEHEEEEEPPKQREYGVGEVVMLEGVDPRCHAEASLDFDGEGGEERAAPMGEGGILLAFSLAFFHGNFFCCFLFLLHCAHLPLHTQKRGSLRRGPAVAWGMSHRTADAGECCARCTAHAEKHRGRGGAAVGLSHSLPGCQWISSTWTMLAVAHSRGVSDWFTWGPYRLSSTEYVLTMHTLLGLHSLLLPGGVTRLVTWNILGVISNKRCFETAQINVV
jgi:hypothetical protein